MCSIRDIGEKMFNELCFKLLLATLQIKSTEIGMNVNNTNIYQNIIQMFLLLYTAVQDYCQVSPVL